LAVNNFVATSNQWKSWCTARIICFNKIFKRNCTISTGFPNFRGWCKKYSIWLPESDKIIWLRHRLLVLVGIRLPLWLQPKTTLATPTPQPCF